MILKQGWTIGCLMYEYQVDNSVVKKKKYVAVSGKAAQNTSRHPTWHIF